MEAGPAAQGHSWCWEARAAGGAKALKTTPERWDIPQEGEGSLTSMEMPGASQETYTYTQRTETVLSGGWGDGSGKLTRGQSTETLGLERGSNESDQANLPTGSTPSIFTPGVKASIRLPCKPPPSAPPRRSSQDSESHSSWPALAPQANIKLTESPASPGGTCPLAAIPQAHTRDFLLFCHYPH